MPPVGFFGSSTGVYSSAGGTEIFLVPQSSRENDVLLAIVVQPSASPITAPAGWTLLASDALGAPISQTCYLFRRLVAAAEPAQHVFAVGMALAPQPVGLLLQYRSVDNTAAIVAHGLTAITPTSVNFAAPSIVLAHYSDLVLLVYFALSAGGLTPTFTLPAGTTQRGPTVYGGGGAGGTLAIAEYLKEAIGATGALQAVCTATNTGLAAQYGVQASPTLLAPSIVPDVAGAIGLPSIGV